MAKQSKGKDTPKNPPLKPKFPVCEDCGEQFTFTVEEQKIFKQKKLSDPKRCKVCYRKMREEKEKKKKKKRKK